MLLAMRMIPGPACKEDILAILAISMVTSQTAASVLEREREREREFAI
jgi:hypothetical protein